ncbi:MAG: DUF5995 family protein [Actinomycetes bacterium]
MGVQGVDTVDDVLTRIDRLVTSLPEDDGVARFAGMYGDTTRLVAARLTGGYFVDPVFMNRLDVLFAMLFFDAVDPVGPPQPRVVPKAWAPLVEERATVGVHPIQYALAGMNAHINHDLALAVVAACEQAGTSPDDADVKTDYDRVNDLLASIEARVRRSFLDECARQDDDRLGPVVHLVSSWSIEAARDAAWVAARTLWALRPLEDVRDVYRASLARQVGLAGRVMLTPCL